MANEQQTKKPAAAAPAVAAEKPAKAPVAPAAAPAAETKPAS